MSDFNTDVIREFRSNGGAVGGPLKGVPLVLVTHHGARTGAAWTTPLSYYDDGDQLVLFASNQGAARHPAWFHNIVPNPRVTVELAEESFEANATVLRGEDRDAVWRRLITARPFLVEHQQKAGNREIPLIALRRLG